MSDATMQRETINESTRQARCAHALCKCTVPQGERYCGEHCAREAARPSRAEGSRCGCAHAPCDESAG
jgi:hypothetical protein